MLEQSTLGTLLRDSSRRAAVRSDTASALLTERGWRVYRASYPRLNGDVSVFCRKAKGSLATRLIVVNGAEIDRRLAERL